MLDDHHGNRKHLNERAGAAVPGGTEVIFRAASLFFIECDPGGIRSSDTKINKDM